MNSAAPTTAPTLALFRKAGWRETTVLLALAWFVPFAIHLVPWSGARPLGAYLLPVMWTTLVAIYFYGELVALAVGLFSPLLNFVVTGQPAAEFFWKTAVEVIAFGLLAGLATRRAPKILTVAAPLVYALAKTVAAALLTPSALASAGDAGKFFVHLVTGSWPGLLALGGIAFALGRLYPKPAVSADE